MTWSRAPYRPKDKVQYAELMALLSQAFGRKYCHYYQLQLERVASPDTTYMLQNECGQIIAHIQVVPYYLHAVVGVPPLKCAYLYAVCTLEAYQGQGVMSYFLPRILPELLQEGYMVALLLPASKGLVEYYQRFGFQLMKGALYTRLPMSVRPAIRPSEVAQEYIDEALKLDALTDTDKEVKRIVGRQNKTELMHHEVGWMAYSLDPTINIPEDTVFLNPMV